MKSVWRMIEQDDKTQEVEDHQFFHLVSLSFSSFAFLHIE